MRTAIVHDWLVTYAGAEKVLEQIIKLFPGADLFSVVDFISPENRTFLMNKSVSTTFIQHLPFAKKNYRIYLPFMPLAIEQLDLSRYDLVVSSSHAVAKGVLTGPNQIHISYVHTPMRYACDLQHQYLSQSALNEGIKGWLTKLILHYMRLWDLRTVNGIDYFIANSDFIAKRIWKTYRRKAKVIYPPVDIDSFALCERKEDFYLASSRMVPYKKMDLIVEAFAAMPSRRLIVIGDGPDFFKIKAKAGKNITILGYQPYPVLCDYMQKAKAFVFAAEEDFGIMPVEAQACGTPVIAFGRGGTLETVRGLGLDSNPTGVFFAEQTLDAVKEAVAVFEQDGHIISSRDCRENAERFAIDKFQDKFMQCVNQILNKRGS